MTMMIMMMMAMMVRCSTRTRRWWWWYDDGSSYADAKLRNVNSLTRNKTFKPNFTPRRARKLRQILHLNRTKLTKRIILEYNCWKLYQLRLVCTEKFNIFLQFFPKKACFCKIKCFSKLFTPHCKYFYTDISVISVTFTQGRWFRTNPKTHQSI